MTQPNVHTPHPSTPNAIRRAKLRARDAWLAVVDAKTIGASRTEIAELEATAREASAAWYEARGVSLPGRLVKAMAA